MLKIHSGLTRPLWKKRLPDAPQPGPLDKVDLSTSKEPRRNPLRWLVTPLLIGAALLGPLAVGMTHSQAQAHLPQAEMQAKLATLRTDLRTHQLRAARGEETGAAALCAVLREEADMSSSSEEFMQLNQALFVHNDWIVDLPTGAPTIPHTRVPQPAAETFVGLPTTGWKVAYRDIHADEDQTHHLAAYVSLGYYRGAEFAGAGAFYHEAENHLKNGGDINLGVLGGKIGADLRHQTPRQAADRMCRAILDPGAKASPVHWNVPDVK